jgi:glutamate/tyrosine decarboxylase-like PLP-dependent enzyme
MTKFGRLIDQNIDQARYLAVLVDENPKLELLTPTIINIVCFRFNSGGMDEAALRAVNQEIMLRMQESGVAAISDTTLQGRHCLRAAITNHRTQRADLDLLAAEVQRLGEALS